MTVNQFTPEWDPQNQPVQPSPTDYRPGTPGPYSDPTPPAPKPRKRGRRWLIGIGVVLAALVGLAQLTPNDDSADDFGTPLPNVVTTPSDAAPTSTAPSAKPSAPATTAPSMTKSQEQAIGAAKQYLSFKAFSRTGLIRQLSSDAGDGYPVADATYAVDHITVNWNDQAAKAAEEYLKIMHFSRQGLIEQLESDAGDGFTHRQAVYGVSKAGL